jgi:uncharacterized protein YbcV (DUF1398 family)
MLTKEKIEQAYKAMKSDNDFPTLVAELKKIEVMCFNFYVKDGSELFWDEEEDNVLLEAKFHVIQISETVQSEKLQEALKIHQKGGTDFLTFRQQAADCGVKFWSVDFIDNTCTYFGKDGEPILIEALPN